MWYCSTASRQYAFSVTRILLWIFQELMNHSDCIAIEDQWSYQRLPVWTTTTNQYGIHPRSKAITNIFALKDVIRQYQVTYNSDELSFVVHREKFGYPNMIFKMHKSRFNYFDPRKQHLTFVETVDGNKALFTKWQLLAGAEQAWQLYISLLYWWMIFCVKDCPVTVCVAEVALKVRGQNIAAQGKDYSQSLVEIPK